MVADFTQYILSDFSATTSCGRANRPNRAAPSWAWPPWVECPRRPGWTPAHPPGAPAPSGSRGAQSADGCEQVRIAEHVEQKHDDEQERADTTSGDAVPLLGGGFGNIEHKPLPSPHNAGPNWNPNGNGPWGRAALLALRLNRPAAPKARSTPSSAARLR